MKNHPPVTLMPLKEVQEHVGNLIQTCQDAKVDGKQMNLVLSMAEYLKDAGRWHYAECNVLPDLSGPALRKYVDKELGVPE